MLDMTFAGNSSSLSLIAVLLLLVWRRRTGGLAACCVAAALLAVDWNAGLEDLFRAFDPEICFRRWHTIAWLQNDLRPLSASGRFAMLWENLSIQWQGVLRAAAFLLVALSAAGSAGFQCLRRPAAHGRRRLSFRLPRRSDIRRHCCLLRFHFAPPCPDRITV